MKRPAIQLYFGDLLKNPRVLRCSWAARGALIWTMSILHDSDEYGAVRWPLAEIAQAVGCPVTLMRELAAKGALKGDDRRVQPYRWAPSHAGRLGQEVELVAEQDGPLWYSSRMIRDEYKRTNRGIKTRIGPGGKLPTGTPTRRHGDGNGDGGGGPTSAPSRGEGDGASSSSSVSSIAKLGGNSNEGGSEPAKGKGAIGKAPNVNGAGQKWGDYAYVVATANTIGLSQRTGEGIADFRDRVYTAVQQRVNEARQAAAGGSA